jgi:hypothetical protein
MFLKNCNRKIHQQKKPQVIEEIICTIWHQKTKDKTWSIIVRKFELLINLCLYGNKSSLQQNTWVSPKVCN